MMHEYDWLFSESSIYSKCLRKAVIRQFPRLESHSILTSSPSSIDRFIASSKQSFQDNSEPALVVKRKNEVIKHQIILFTLLLKFYFSIRARLGRSSIGPKLQVLILFVIHERAFENFILRLYRKQYIFRFIDLKNLEFIL